MSSYHHRFSTSPASAVVHLTLTCKAVSLLSTNLGTDDLSLAAVTLLALADLLSHDGDPWRTQIAHQKGMHAILASRPSVSQMNAFAKATVRTCAATKFIDYCLSGEPSPWDDERWLRQDMRHDAADSKVPGFARLRDVNFRLLVKLPGMIKAVRSRRGEAVKAQLCPEDRANQATLALAKQLLDLEDRRAENEVLHCMRVVRTRDSAKAAVMKYSYDVGSLEDSDSEGAAEAVGSHEDFDTALHYWTLRLMTLRLCLRLNALWPESFDHDGLLAEHDRLMVNVLMVYFQQHLYPPAQALALVVLWGALSEKKMLRDTPTSVVARWVWRQLEALLPLPAEMINPGSLNETAEMFVGGPVAGLFVVIRDQGG